MKKTKLQAFQWYGGKGHCAEKILQFFPPHRIYVEVFGGAGTLLLRKRPAEIEVYNDINEGLVNFFRVVSNPVQFEAFLRRVAPLPYSRQLYRDCRNEWEKQTDPVEKAWRWFVVARQSYGGVFDMSWGSSVTASTSGMAMSVATWLSGIEGLPAIHRRLQRVQIENQDFRTILERYDNPETLFYCDPPYVLSTRKGEAYRHEMSDADHRDLVELLLKLKGFAVLSGYKSPLYQPLEDAGWRRAEWKTLLGGVRDGSRTECLWFPQRHRKIGLFQETGEEAQ